MCWADKIALILFALFAAALFFLGLTSGHEFRWDLYLEILAPIGFKIFLPIWIVLRVIDLAGGGPARRRGQVTVHRIY
jgi:hypothetical protein